MISWTIKLWILENYDLDIKNKNPLSEIMIWTLQMWIPFRELSSDYPGKCESSMENYVMATSNVNPFWGIIIYPGKSESSIPMDNYDMDTSNVNPKCESLWGNYHLWTIMTWTLQMWISNVNPFGGIIIYGQLWHGHFKCECTVGIYQLDWLKNFWMIYLKVMSFYATYKKMYLKATY